MEQKTNPGIIPIAKAVLFLLIFLFLFYFADKVFLAKNENYYNFLSFINQEEESIDILIMGSSHSVDGLEAADLDQILQEEYGIEVKSFNMSKTGMRLEQINYRFKEALKTQKPSLLIIETFSCAPQSTGTEESINRWSLDYVPLSKEKAEFIEKEVEESLKTSFYLPFIKYHARWRELTKEDWEILSPSKTKDKWQHQGIGAPHKPNFIGVPDDYFEQDFTAVTEVKELPKDYLVYVDEIVSMCKEINCKIMFISIPYKVQADFYNTELIKYNNYLEQYVEDGENIVVYDMNKLIGELNWGYEHMTDEGHVNNLGRDVINRKAAEEISKLWKGEQNGF